ncbi:MAG: substrate-binding domain-containing protein [Planctomycetota bacterium]
MSNSRCEPIRVAGVPEHFNLPWHLAIESGSFEERGLDVRYVDYPGGTGAMTRALGQGEVDVAILLAEGAVADLIRRRQTRLVKVYVRSPLIWGIHVADDSEITSIDQIRDRTYAISRPGSGSHLMAIVDASERGWNTDDLDFEVVRNLDGARKALADDEADIFLWEKFTTQPFVDNGEFRRVGHRETLWPAFVIAVNADVLMNRRDDIRSMLEVINRQCDQLMKNPEAIQLVATRYQLEESQVREWLSLTRWSTDFECPHDSIQKILKYLNHLEIIDAPDATVNEVWEDLNNND